MRDAEARCPRRNMAACGRSCDLRHSGYLGMWGVDKRREGSRALVISRSVTQAAPSHWLSHLKNPKTCQATFYMLALGWRRLPAAPPKQANPPWLQPVENNVVTDVREVQALVCACLVDTEKGCLKIYVYVFREGRGFASPPLVQLSIEEIEDR